MRSESYHPHTHRFEGEPETVYFEDAAFLESHTCRYVEQSYAGHSERLDESFYETEYECDHEEMHRFDLKFIGVEQEDGDASPLFELDEDETVHDVSLEEYSGLIDVATLIEEVEESIADEICQDRGAEVTEWCTDRVEVDHDEDEYVVFYHVEYGPTLRLEYRR